MAEYLEIEGQDPNKRDSSPSRNSIISVGADADNALSQPHKHKLLRLSDADLATVTKSIGGTFRGADGVEGQKPIHPTSFIYPPKGLPEGLYKDVVRERFRCQYAYYSCSFLFNLSLILQLILGALLTALGSSAKGKDVLITIFAALNTVNAGLLALMHNSGLPDRYQKDWDEFDRVESFMKELMDTGIIYTEMTKEEAVELCYANYRKAKATISRNLPSSYTETTRSAATPPPK